MINHHKVVIRIWKIEREDLVEEEEIQKVEDKATLIERKVKKAHLEGVIFAKGAIIL